MKILKKILFLFFGFAAITMLTQKEAYSLVLLTVQNCNDSGAGSLRAQINTACKNNDDVEILFQSGYCGTVTLSSPLVVKADTGNFCSATSIKLIGDIPADAKKVTIKGNVNCALEIPFDTSITVGNINFNSNSTGPAICVDGSAKHVTLSNNQIGIIGNVGTGIDMTPAPNTIGVRIDGAATLSGNTIAFNTGAGVAIQNDSANNVINNGNLITNNGDRGIVLSGTAASLNNIISGNSIFGNNGLGIDLVAIRVADGANGVTLHADNFTTPNSSINLAEDVIITPLGGNNYSFSANSYAKNINNLIVEIYTPGPNDNKDPKQVRDGRSYGEGQTFVQRFDGVQTSNDLHGSFSVTFTGKPNTAYSALLTIPTKGTSEFSAVVKTGTDTNSKDPICEGEGGDGKGDGVQSPKAPTNLAAGRNPDKSVLLTFTDNSVAPAKADGFKIERAELGAAANCSAATGYSDVTATLKKNPSTPPTVSFTDAGAAADSKALCYKVTAFRNIPNSDNHDLKTCVASAIVGLAPAAGGGNPNPTDKPPVIVVNPNPTQPTDPVVVIITDNSVNETAFCVLRADKSCQAAKDGDFKPVGEVTSPNTPGTGETVPYQDPTAEPGHNYCYRAEPKINGTCAASLVSNDADASKLNKDGSIVPPDALVAEGSGGCSIGNTASHFNFLSLIALLAIAPVALTRAFKFRKV